MISLRIFLAGDGLKLLYRSDIPPGRLAAFARQANLSRYVGRIKAWKPCGNFIRKPRL